MRLGRRGLLRSVVREAARTRRRARLAAQRGASSLLAPGRVAAVRADVRTRARAPSSAASAGAAARVPGGRERPGPGSAPGGGPGPSPRPSGPRGGAERRGRPRRGDPAACGKSERSGARGSPRGGDTCRASLRRTPRRDRLFSATAAPAPAGVGLTFYPVRVSLRGARPGRTPATGALPAQAASGEPALSRAAQTGLGRGAGRGRDPPGKHGGRGARPTAPERSSARPEPAWRAAAPGSARSLPPGAGTAALGRFSPR